MRINELRMIINRYSKYVLNIFLGLKLTLFIWEQEDVISITPDTLNHSTHSVLSYINFMWDDVTYIIHFYMPFKKWQETNTMRHYFNITRKSFSTFCFVLFWWDENTIYNCINPLFRSKYRSFKAVLFVVAQSNLIWHF